MPDLADLAQIQQERLAPLTQKRAPAGPEATGFCLYCAAPLPEGQRWCDAECRDEWQRLEAILYARGL